MIKKNIGLIGAGNWGKNILRNLADIGRLHTVCDTSKVLTGQYRKQYPKVHFTNTMFAVINNPEVSAVAVATPAATHYDVVKHCLNAGKDVFVEKPLALKPEQGQELADLAKKRKRVLMVGHILQYHPAIIKLKQMIRNGDLGKLQYIYSHRLNIGTLRTEENILWSFAPHDISVILSLVGEEPVTVHSFGGNYITPGIYDTTLTDLEFSSGCRAHVFVSWLHPVKEQKLVVIGSKSMVIFDDLTREKLFCYPHTIEWESGKIPIVHKAEAKIIPIDSGEPLRNELLHYIECCRRRKPPLTDGAEGIRVLRVLDQAEKSLTGKPSAAPGQLPYFVHATSVIDQSVSIGKNTKIWHYSHILKNTRIGENCIFGQNCMVGPDVSIGNNCKLQNNISVYKGVTLENDVFVGPSAVFTNVINPRSFIERKNEFRNTLVKKGASIGANSTILCGITIGKYAFIGAGAMVTRDVPDYGLVYGSPAKLKGWVCKCGTKLTFTGSRATCAECKAKYKSARNGIIPVK